MTDLQLPDDPFERLVRLLDVEQEIDMEYARAYFDARLTGQIDAAIELRRHSRKDILAMTRRLNHESGQQVSWGDGIDRRSIRTG